MKVNNRIEIEFAGVMLPVEQDEQGNDVVPAKPICDAIGVRWPDQHKKMQGAYFARRLGTCMGAFQYAGQSREMVCIRVDRVIAFLNSINPDQVRGGGNHKAADFLEEKHQEWDDVLHEYESRKGGMLEAATTELKNRAINLRLYLAVLREKRNAIDETDRKALSLHASQLSANAGVPYQPELTQ